MLFSRLHPWPRTPRSAIALQRTLRSRLRLEPIPDGVYLIAGADLALSPDGAQLIAGIVVWDLRTQTVVEQQLARVPCRFPYVPGLLSFRETPGVLAAARKLKLDPHVFLCDGQGYAHPRRLGLACHMGLWLGRPTIGCAKSRLCGEYNEPGPRRGCAAALMHDGEQVGLVLRTRDHVKPLFVSPGHLCDIGSARRLALLTATHYRLPEPARLAHQLVTRSRNL